MLCTIEAKVIEVIKKNDFFYLIFDKTIFYPKGGGQESDQGFLIMETGKKIEILEVFKKGIWILHKTKEKVEKGEKVVLVIDKRRRQILTAQHDAVHLLNGVARDLLGKHVWQAGSFVGEDKAHLDITHYKKLTEDEIEEIEYKMNEHIIENIPILKYILERKEAEKRFGFRIYQGGAIPGSHLRIVEIEGVDVEACGGTHGNNTREIQHVFLTKVSKIQDNIYRFELVASENAYLYYKKLKGLLNETAKDLKVSLEEVPKTSKKFFEQWKELKKEKEKLESYLLENSLSLIENKEEDIVEIPLDTNMLFQLTKKTEKILKNDSCYIAKFNEKNREIMQAICKEKNLKEDNLKFLKDIILLKIK